MAWKKTDDTNYTNIANKLRVQKPNETFLPSEMNDAIDDINSDIANAYTACQSKGATLPQSQISANLAGTIQNIPERNTLDEYFADTLEVANIPSASSIGIIFRGKLNLVNVIMPNVTNIGNSAFQGCTSLALTSLPNGIISIGASAFDFCTSLALTSLPNGIRSIGASAFKYCDKIIYLDFSNFTQIPALGGNAFFGTTCPFYFRDQQQLDEWAAATNWSKYADRFQIKPSGVI